MVKITYHKKKDFTRNRTEEKDTVEAKQWSRKTNTLLSHTNTPIQQKFIEKFHKFPLWEAQKLKGSHTPDKCETRLIEAIRKIWDNPLTRIPTLAQHHTIRKRHPVPSFSQGREEVSLCIQWPIFLKGLPKGMAFVLPVSNL